MAAVLKAVVSRAAHSWRYCGNPTEDTSMVDPYPTFYSGGGLGVLTRTVQAIEDAIGARRAGSPSLVDAVTGNAATLGLTQRIEGIEQTLNSIGDVVTHEGAGILAIYSAVSDVDDAVANQTTGLPAIRESLNTGADYSAGEGIGRVVAVLEGDSGSRQHDLQVRLAVTFIDDLVPVMIWWLSNNKTLAAEVAEAVARSASNFVPTSLVQLYAVRYKEMFKTMEGYLGNQQEFLTAGLPDIRNYWERIRTRYGEHTDVLVENVPSGDYLGVAIYHAFLAFLDMHSSPSGASSRAAGASQSSTQS